MILCDSIFKNKADSHCPVASVVLHKVVNDAGSGAKVSQGSEDEYFLTLTLLAVPLPNGGLLNSTVLRAPFPWSTRPAGLKPLCLHCPESKVHRPQVPVRSVMD